MTDAFSALAAGGVALLGTDTVYGLAALPASEGEKSIYSLKNRPMDQPLAQLVSGVEMMREIASELQPYALRLAEMFWPGALTLVVKAADGVTKALRCPDDATCLKLIERLDSPLVCTSANLHGQPTPQCREDLPASFACLPGASELPQACGAVASTIVDCTGLYPKLLREGPIPAHVVWDVAVFDDTLV